MGSSKFYETERQLIYSFNKNNIDSLINNKNYVYLYIYLNNLFNLFFKDIYILKYIKNSFLFKFNNYFEYNKFLKYKKKNILKFILGNVWYLKYNNWIVIIFFFFHNYSLKNFIRKKTKKINIKIPIIFKKKLKILNLNYKYIF